MQPTDSLDAVATRAVSTLSGVGPTLVATLARLGLTTLQDLWFHLPLRYEDKTRITPISELRIGEAAQVAIGSDHPKACILPDIYHLYNGGSGFNGLASSHKAKKKQSVSKVVKSVSNSTASSGVNGDTNICHDQSAFAGPDNPLPGG